MIILLGASALVAMVTGAFFILTAVIDINTPHTLFYKRIVIGLLTEGTGCILGVISLLS